MVFITQRGSSHLACKLTIMYGCWFPFTKPGSLISCFYQAYTVLESSTDAVFLHLTMSSTRDAEWGNLLKSNSNGTYYGLSLEYANRNDKGYVDFEKMIGLDGIAVMNIVANPDTAAAKGKKDLQTRITHNDGKLNKPCPIDVSAYILS